jgi:hypothetical protein
MTDEEFLEILSLVETGEATETELRECLIHCAGTSRETTMLFKALCKGYRAHLAELTRKDAKIRAAIEFTKKAVKQ